MDSGADERRDVSSVVDEERNATWTAKRAQCARKLKKARVVAGLAAKLHHSAAAFEHGRGYGLGAVMGARLGIDDGVETTHVTSR